MDENDFSESCRIYDPAQPELFSLPVEIFLKICSYLDAEFISKTLSKVCRRFEDILADNMLWKFWVSRRIKGRYPALPWLKVWEEGEINWEDACIDIDNEYNKWKNVSKTMKHLIVKDVHYASVDTVLLINNGNLCVSGGRDRALALWNVPNIYASRDECEGPNFVNCKPTVMETEAHQGWVWDLAADSLTSPKFIYSASWDNTVKAWDIETGLECKQTFLCGMSALTVETIDNLVYAGLFSRKVLTFDLRVGPKSLYSYKIHRGPVLTMVTNGDIIISASEDKTIGVWDVRAHKPLHTQIKLSDIRSYPVCLNWKSSSLYVGDSKGSLYLIDTEKYNVQASYEIWPEAANTSPPNKITGIYQGLGSLIACTAQGEIKCLYPSHPPQEFTRLQAATVEITKLQYRDDILVIGSSDSAIEFWIPVDKFNDSVD